MRFGYFRPGRFFWKLFLGHAALTTLVLGTCVWLIIWQFERHSAEAQTPYLKTQAAALRSLVGDRLDQAKAGEFQRLADELGQSAIEGMRITFMAPDGTVVGDSEAHPAQMENHLDRPEIRQALDLEKGWGESTRLSATVGHELNYVAVRVGTAEDPGGVIRVAMATSTIIAQMETPRRLMWRIGLLALLAATALALGLAWIWSSRIERVTRVARSFARGDLSRRVPVDGHDEVALLGRSLNRMRDRLLAQLQTIDDHRRTLEALLGQLLEGVVVARRDGSIMLINPAARRLLSLSEHLPAGIEFDHHFQVEACIPQRKLQDLLRLDDQADEPAPRSPEHVDEIRIEVVGTAGSVTLLARATDIKLPLLRRGSGESGDGPAPPTGRLLVLSDITALTRAMKIKSDFVANASHELRTPLSAIRAAVETILKMDMTHEGPAAQRFLEVIARHSLRLEALASDLLDLSRVEAPAGRFLPATLNLVKHLADLHQRWADALEARSLQWQCDVPPDCHLIVANAYLLDIILDNLVDNAIKFTPPGGRVGVEAHADVNVFRLEVWDTGRGIASDDLERVFERFYRVGDAGGVKANEPRGTGLGLSIVKHAVAAMEGTVRLQSRPGHGTRAVIRIPRQPTPS